MRASARQRHGALGCGSPVGCSRLATHEVVDPVYGGVFGACDDHWPDFVAMLWSEGAFLSDCPCQECVHASDDRSRPHAP